ncbi:phage terminase family protein [Corynebacterium cystitidis]|uniref:phage terminase family protein n=1 Tax=Corynebacterium cystitidis TaxID=35757 RepID=UPI00211F1AFB|nr:phage terminase family protein [Corynebacterium cystitidis]
MDSPTSDFNARFWEIIEEEWPTLEGRQEPQRLVCWRGGDTTHGEKAIRLASRFGIRLMPWQREQVLLALAVDEGGKWLHPDVVLICPRQNGKSLILEVIMLYRLFVLHHKIIFSAQRWSTAKSIRNRMWAKIKSRKWARDRLTRNTSSAGEAEMETVDGGKIQYTTRSGDMGRGFDEVDLWIADEAYNLDSAEIDAVAPTQLAAEDPQSYFTSSAVNRVKHSKGDELSRMRARVLSDEEDTTTLYAEFCAPDGMGMDDRLAWMLANPSYGVIADEKKIMSMRKKLSDDGFQVEMLGWGAWFDDGVDGDQFLVDLDLWEELVLAPPPFSDACLGVGVQPDGAAAGVVLAQLMGDGRVFLSANPLDTFDRDEIVAAAKRVVDEVDPVANVFDPFGPGSTLEDAFDKAGVGYETLNGGQVSAGYELLIRMVAEGKVAHDGDPRWLDQWQVADERGKGRYRSFDRFSGDVTLLDAASMALFGLVEFGAVSGPVGPRPAKRLASSAGAPRLVRSSKPREYAF